MYCLLDFENAHQGKSVGAWGLVKDKSHPSSQPLLPTQSTSSWPAISAAAWKGAGAQVRSAAGESLDDPGRTRCSRMSRQPPARDVRNTSWRLLAPPFLEKVLLCGLPFYPAAGSGLLGTQVSFSTLLVALFLAGPGPLPFSSLPVHLSCPHSCASELSERCGSAWLVPLRGSFLPVGLDILFKPKLEQGRRLYNYQLK